MLKRTLGQPEVPGIRGVSEGKVLEEAVPSSVTRVELSKMHVEATCAVERQAWRGLCETNTSLESETVATCGLDIWLSVLSELACKEAWQVSRSITTSVLESDTTLV